MKTTIKGRRIKIPRLDKAVVEGYIKQNKEVLEREVLNLPNIGVVVKADTSQDKELSSLRQSQNNMSVPETLEVNGVKYKIFQQ